MVEDILETSKSIGVGIVILIFYETNYINFENHQNIYNSIVIDYS